MAESLAAMTPDGDGLTRPISAPGGPDRSGQRHGSAHYRSRRSYGAGVGVADDGDGLPSPGERHVEVVHVCGPLAVVDDRSEEHTSEIQSLMRISYAVFCLKKKKNKPQTHR